MKEQIEKQAIEEMAKVIKSSLDGLGIGNFNFTGDEISTMFAKALYNAGYSKQSEGEWVANRHISISKRNRTIHYETYKCSVCGVWNGRHKQKFCPNCGAKMKGD